MMTLLASRSVGYDKRKIYTAAVIVASAIVTSIFIVEGYHNLLISAYVLLLTSILFIKNIGLGINTYIICSYFLPFISKIVYAYQRNVPLRDFLTSLPDWLLIGIFLIFITQKVLNNEKIIRYKLDKYLIIYLVVNLLYVVYNKNGITSGIYGARVTIFPLFMYFFSRKYFTSSSKFKSFAAIVLVCSIIDILYGLYQHFVGFPYFDIVRLYDFPDIYRTMIGAWQENLDGFEGFHKIFSLSGGSYSLHYPLAFFFIIFCNIYFGFLRRSEIKYIFVLFTFLLLLLFSLGIERTPTAMLIIGIIASRINLTNKKEMIKSILKISFLIFIILFAFQKFSAVLLSTGDARYKRISELANPMESKTVGSRSNIQWQQAIQLIKESKGIGYGVGTGSTLSSRINPYAFNYQTHNMFFSILLETGILGLFSFTLLMLVIVHQLLMIIRHSKNFLFIGFSRGLIGAMVAIFAAGLFNEPFKYHLGIFFWFLIGVIPILYKETFNNKGKPALQ